MRANRDVRRIFLAGCLILAAAVAAPGAAQASALSEARAAGHLGERYDGYVGVVNDGAPDSAKALAKEVNAKRKVHYAKIAAKDGADVSAVAAIAGAKLVKNAASGEHVMPAADAGWKRVP